MRKKVCRRCGEEKLLTMFDREGKTKDGRKGTCKACRSAISDRTRMKPLLYSTTTHNPYTFDGIAEEVVATGIASSDRHQRRRAQRFDTLHDNSNVDDVAADALFDAWDRMVRQDADTAADLKERLPIFTEHSEQQWIKHRTTSYEEYFDETYDLEWDIDD